MEVESKVDESTTGIGDVHSLADKNGSQLSWYSLDVKSSKVHSSYFVDIIFYHSIACLAADSSEVYWFYHNAVTITQCPVLNVPALICNG